MNVATMVYSFSGLVTVTLDLQTLKVKTVSPFLCVISTKFKLSTTNHFWTKSLTRQTSRI